MKHRTNHVLLLFLSVAIVALGASLLADDCCVGERGHVTVEPNCDLSDDGCDISDLTTLINHLFISFDPLCCVGEADLSPWGNPDGSVDIADLTGLIDHLFISFGQLPVCSDGDIPSADCTGRSECLSMPDPEKRETFEEECLSWYYAGGVLDLFHESAGLNCCPDYDPVVIVSGDSVTIDLSVTEGLCYCLCPFDLTYQVTNLPQGVYQVQVIEAVWLHGDTPISFELDLTSEPTGTVCEARTGYPWGEY